MKHKLKNIISSRYPGVDFDVFIPPDEKMGDYSTNVAFVSAKKAGKDPMKVGEDLAYDLGKDKVLTDIFEKIEAVNPGFVNFYLSQGFLQKEVVAIVQNEKYGTSDIGKGKKVIVEYSSPNIAKPMHVGHLRSTVIGDALANVYEALGYAVIRWNYIGDWGTQFGKLLVAYKWIDKDAFGKNPMNEMVRIYVKFHEEAKMHPNLEDDAREAFTVLEGIRGTEELYEKYIKIWKDLRQVSLKEFESEYKRLGIHSFDKNWGESKFAPNLNYTLGFLGQLNLLTESDGAKIINLEKFNLPPALIWKSDGAGLYLAREIATLRDRIENYSPHKILYVVANQQTLHFQQLFAVVELVTENSLSRNLLLGNWLQVELMHVKFGMVLGEDGKKLATREGKVILLQEVIDKITALARKVVTQKNSALSEEEINTIAQTVGVGALKYNDLKQHPYSDITFDWEAMLNFTGNSGPYLQYTYARLMSILTKSENRASEKANTALLEDPKEQKIMKQLLEFPEAIEKCAELYTLNGLALYLYELSNDANRFYESVRVLDDENIERRNARLMLVETVASILERGLGLLGISVLKKI